MKKTSAYREYREGQEYHVELNSWPWEVGRPPACTHAITDTCVAMLDRQTDVARRLREIREQIGAH